MLDKMLQNLAYFENEKTQMNIFFVVLLHFVVYIALLPYIKVLYLRGKKCPKMAKFEAEFTRQFHQALTSIFQKSDNHSIIYII